MEYVRTSPSAARYASARLMRSGRDLQPELPAST